MCVLSYKIYIKYIYESYDANFSLLFTQIRTKKLLFYVIITHTQIYYS